ncbi:MAG: nitroreductase family protein [Candidatus Methanofastidiosia archaeon]|jgi:nitroreductase
MKNEECHIDLFEAINQRKCIRSYTTEKVTDEEINTLLKAAIRAPSGGNRQTWRFVIVRNPETIEILYKAASYSTQHQTFVKKAPVSIVVCADLNPYKRLPYKDKGENLFVIQDTAAAIQNLLLAAHALGLGACWVGLFDEELIKEPLKIPKDVKPVAIIPLGHTKSKAKPTPRKPLEDVVFFETFER